MRTEQATDGCWREAQPGGASSGSALPVTPIRIGLISDTHGYLDPRLADHFRGVEHILHAGDIGCWSVIQALEEIAPVTAVLGNTDFALSCPETEVLELCARTFLLQHILDPYEPAEAVRRRLERDAPEVVVFGHTHKPFAERIGSTLFINPGYAGKKRFALRRSVAILHCSASAIVPEFYYL
jgi:putative phosphoesterase